MSFLNLAALWIAAAAVPTLLILYFLKLRRRDEVVPSTLLWKRAVQDLQVNAPFQKLRKNLLLFLQLLVLAAAILALARPIVETGAAAEKSVVILIDRSASMNTREGDQARLEQAKEQAIRLVKTLNRTGSRWFTFSGTQDLTRVMVIAFASRATVVAPFTTNTGDLENLIRGISPTDEVTQLREALELAEAYLAPPTMTTDTTPVPAGETSKLILFSDGGIRNVDDVVLRTNRVELRAIGEANDNVGITALRTQRNYEQPEILNVFLQVRNFGPQPVESDLELYVDETLRKVRPVSLTAGMAALTPENSTTAPAASELPPEGSALSLGFEFPLDRGAVLKARLVRNDALAADNAAYAIVPPPRTLRVLLVTAGNFLLESVLKGLPIEPPVVMKPEAYEAAADDDLAANGVSRYDVVIFDKHASDRLPAGAYIFFGAVPKIDAFPVPEEEAPRGPVAVMWWDEAHPVLRHVGLDYVVVSQRQHVQFPPQTEILAEGPDGPLIGRYADEGRHFLVVTFAVEHSNWWSKPAFPVFAYNALRYLGSAGSPTEQRPTRPGDTILISVPPDKSEVRVHHPDGSDVRLEASPAGRIHYGGTQQVGLYRVDPGLPGRDRFAVNLEDDAESNVAPRQHVTIGGQDVAVGRLIATETPEAWRWLVGAALAVVLLEWYIYNRRVMI